MKTVDLAKKYLEIFCSGRNFDQLTEIFSEKLKFRGPLFEFNSAEAYIDNLKADPPVGCHVKMIRIFESDHWVSFIYQFSKSGIDTPMSQSFKIENGKITEILLIFDTKKFIRV